MKQFKTFFRPVQKAGGTGEIIGVGDPLTLVLRDNSETVVTVATIEKGGRRLGWHLHGGTNNITTTSSQNATAAASDDTTGNALANALKTSYNAAQVDVAAVFTSQEALGAPTSAQNATAAASDDATRLALANALRANLLTLIADVTEIHSAHPELGDVPVVAADVDAIATDDTTTNSLLNNLQEVYNSLQESIAAAVNAVESSGYFQPRSSDVIAVGGNHRIACPEDEGEYALHDGPEEADTFPDVENPLGVVQRSSAMHPTVVNTEGENPSPKGVLKKKAVESSEEDESEPAPKKAKKAPSKRKIGRR